MNARNLYGIYSKLTDFLDEPQQQPAQPSRMQQVEQATSNIGDKFNEYKDKLKEKIFTRPPEDPREARLHQSSNAPPTQQRSTSFMGKLEQKWDEYKKPKSPQRQQSYRIPTDNNVERRKIFEVQSSNLAAKPLFLSKNLDSTPKQRIFNQYPSQVSIVQEHQQEEQDSFAFSRTILRLEQESTTIEEMYYQDNNEEEILNTLILKLGSTPNPEKLAMLLENLTKKNREVTKQLSINAFENQGLLQQGFVMQDSIIFRVNQCYARVQRSRYSLKLLKETHSLQGIKIQAKLKQKGELEQSLANLKRFYQKYSMVYELISELSKEKSQQSDYWQLSKVTSMKDQIWVMSKETKYQMHTYTCFNDIRGFIEGLFQNQLEYSFRFFTQNIITTFLAFNDKPQKLIEMVDIMIDYLLHYELNNKTMDLTKYIRNSLQAQFRSIVRQNIESEFKQDKSLLRRNFKFDSLKSLNVYFKAFLIAFYKSAYALNRMATVFQQLAANAKVSKQKCMLLKKISFQYSLEKNQFWQYIQDKCNKTLKRTRLDIGCAYHDWIRFEQIILRIIQIGEELSNQKSDTLLNHLNEYLRMICQGISFGIAKCFSVQKGVGTFTPKVNNTQLSFFSKLDKYIKAKRLESKSQYLIELINPKELLVEVQVDVASSNQDQIYNKNEEYYFIISQLQELLLFGQSVPQLQIDCFLHTIHCLEYYAYLLIKQDCNEQTNQMVQEIHVPEFRNLDSDYQLIIQAHDWICQYSQYIDLRQMIAKQIDSARSSNISIQVSYASPTLKEVIENISLLIRVLQYVTNEYQMKHREDKQVVSMYLEKVQLWIAQLQQFWLSKQANKDTITYIDKSNVQSFQLLKSFNDLSHHIQKSNQVLNTKLTPQYITTIYYSAYVRQLSQIVTQLVNKNNKLQFLAEINKFQKQLVEHYSDEYLNQFIGLLDVKTQNKCFETIISSKLVPLPLQITLLQKEFNMSPIYNKLFYESYYQYITHIIL